MDKVKKIEIGALVMGSFFEIYFLGEDDTRLSTKYISCKQLKRMGVIKRNDSFNKAEKWLNTAEGRAWVA